MSGSGAIRGTALLFFLFCRSLAQDVPLSPARPSLDKQRDGVQVLLEVLPSLWEPLEQEHISEEELEETLELPSDDLGPEQLPEEPLEEGFPEQLPEEPLEEGLPEQLPEAPLEEGLPEQLPEEPVEETWELPSDELGLPEEPLEGLPEQLPEEPLDETWELPSDELGLPEQLPEEPLEEGLPEQLPEEPLEEGLPEQLPEEPLEEGLPEQLPEEPLDETSELPEEPAGEDAEKRPELFLAVKVPSQFPLREYVAGRHDLGPSPGPIPDGPTDSSELPLSSEVEDLASSDGLDAPELQGLAARTNDTMPADNEMLQLETPTTAPPARLQNTETTGDVTTSGAWRSASVGVPIVVAAAMWFI